MPLTALCLARSGSHHTAAADTRVRRLATRARSYSTRDSSAHTPSMRTFGGMAQDPDERDERRGSFAGKTGLRGANVAARTRRPCRLPAVGCRHLNLSRAVSQALGQRPLAECGCVRGAIRGSACVGSRYSPAIDRLRRSLRQEGPATEGAVGGRR